MEYARRTAVSLLPSSTTVYYINGIWGSSQDVEQASADAIQQAMTAAGQVDAGHVTSIFNPTEGHVLDVFRKLLLQKAQERWASLIDRIHFADRSRQG
ncbi:hypothetical protein [Paraburkholderia youngii]|uniref:hypothetical protein n=1 Tax=Paraburkholderia youngii TaxID=2782701 RepID=UPI003D246CD0